MYIHVRVYIHLPTYLSVRTYYLPASYATTMNTCFLPRCSKETVRSRGVVVVVVIVVAEEQGGTVVRRAIAGDRKREKEGERWCVDSRGRIPRVLDSLRLVIVACRVKRDRVYLTNIS